MGTLLEAARKDLNWLPLTVTDETILLLLDEGKEADSGINNIKLLTRTTEIINKLTVNAELIVWLCSRSAKFSPLLPHGIRIRGYRIDKLLDLNSLIIPLPLSLKLCLFPNGITFRNASLVALNLAESKTAGLDADSASVSGDIILSDGFSSDRPVCLMGARIKGDLNCIGGHFEDKEPCETPSPSSACKACRTPSLNSYVLTLEHAKIDGSVYLCGNFHALGGVMLADATIGANLNCIKGKFDAMAPLADSKVERSGRRLSCNADGDKHRACAFNGDGMHVKGNLLLNNVEVNGEWRLTGAVIDSDIETNKGYFNHSGSNAIHADRVRVRGNIYFSDGFKVNGTVRLPCAEIGADLSFRNAELLDANSGLFVLFCEGVRVKGSVYLNHLTAKGGVHLFHSTIGGVLNCNDSSFQRDDIALNAMGIIVSGSVFLKRITARGLVSFTGSNVGMDFICSDGKFEAFNPCALNANGMTISGSVKMNGNFIANGGVGLDETTIGNSFLCNGGKFIAPERVEGREKIYAISAGKLQVDGSVYFDRGFEATGEVMLNDSALGRNLVCRLGKIKNADSFSLRASRTKVAGSVLLSYFTSEGEVRMKDSIIGRNLDCSRASFIKESKIQADQEEGKYAFRADGIRITGDALFMESYTKGILSLKNAFIGNNLKWVEIRNPEETEVDLRSAKAKTLEDKRDSWPSIIKLNGFEYQWFLANRAIDLQPRLDKWLKNQPPQPYEHLAAVLTRSGHERDSVKVLFRKNRERDILRKRILQAISRKPNAESDRQTESSGEGRFILAWHWLLGILVGYGYKPFKAVAWALLLVAFGFMFFDIGFKKGVLVESRDGGYHIMEEYPSTGTTFAVTLPDSKHGPSFNKKVTNERLALSFIYSLDTFFPIDLQIGDYYLPQPNSSLGKLLVAYRSFLIFSGWVLTAFFIAALGGIVRR